MNAPPPPSTDAPEDPAQPTLDSVWAEFRGQVTLLMNDAVVKFMAVFDDDQIDAFLPDHPEDFDTWIESKMSAFQKTEDPSHDMTLDAAATLLFMDFGEYVMELMEDDPPPDPGAEADPEEVDEYGAEPEYEVVTTEETKAVAMAAGPANA